MTTWQQQVYGGCKNNADDGSSQPSKNVQDSPNCATGPETKAVSKYDLPVDGTAIVACREKIIQMHKTGYSWETIGKIGGVPRGTAWHYGNGNAPPDAAFIDSIMGVHGTRQALAEMCPDCGKLHIAGRCNDQPIAAVVILAPGERVAPLPQSPARRRTPYAAISIPRELREELDRLRQDNETWADLLERLKALAQLTD